MVHFQSKVVFQQIVTLDSTDVFRIHYIISVTNPPPPPVMSNSNSIPFPGLRRDGTPLQLPLGAPVEHPEQPVLHALRSPFPLSPDFDPRGGPHPPVSPQRGDVPLSIMHGRLPLDLVVGAAHCLATHRLAQLHGEAFHLRAVRPELPVPFGLRQAQGAEPQGSSSCRQALLLRRLRNAVQVLEIVQEAQAQSRAREAAREEQRGELEERRRRGGLQEPRGEQQRPGVQLKRDHCVGGEGRQHRRCQEGELE
jgi:hypothetical protein